MRTSNYSAFYVSEPFNPSPLRANATKDFCHYNMLKAWKGKDSTFPFNDAHDKTYNVRDGSNWELTLKPRLRKRLKFSKNIILFLSSITKNSRALREEIYYGINVLGLPVIVVYTDYSTTESLLTSSGNGLNTSIMQLWNNLPVFRDSKLEVPILHIPNKQHLIRRALEDKDLMVQTKCEAKDYFYK